jgi:hydrogenase maturation protease
MEASGVSESRVLCLGNDVLADDAFGLVVAAELRALAPHLDVAESMESGVRLLDAVLGVDRVIVVDTVQTGRVVPGTVMVLDADEIDSVGGNSPHYMGLFEAIELGRCLGLPVAPDIQIVAVEAADCLTLGGAMHPDVQRALGPVVDIVMNTVNCEDAIAEA